jgi:Zn-dependent protease
MAVFWVIMIPVFVALIPDANIADGFVTMAQIGLVFNLVLGVLNLLPIPPLDGGRVLAGLVPRNMADLLDKVEPYGFPILIVLLLLGVLDKIIGPIIGTLYQLLTSII